MTETATQAPPQRLFNVRINGKHDCTAYGVDALDVLQQTNKRLGSRAADVNIVVTERKD